MAGRYISVSMDSIAVFGDEDFNAAERSADAELRYAWTNEGIEFQDGTYTVHSKTARVPAAKDVHKSIDAASRGDDKPAGTILQWMTS